MSSSGACLAPPGVPRDVDVPAEASTGSRGDIAMPTSSSMPLVLESEGPHDGIWPHEPERSVRPHARSDEEARPRNDASSPLPLPPSHLSHGTLSGSPRHSSQSFTRSPAAAYFQFECVEESAAASLGEVLRSVFSTFAAVEEVCIKSSFVDAKTDRLRGSGFVHFTNDEAGRAAVLASSRELYRSKRLGVLVSAEVSNTFLRHMEELQLQREHSYGHGRQRLLERYGHVDQWRSPEVQPWCQQQNRGIDTRERYSEGQSRYHSNSHLRSPRSQPYPYSYSQSSLGQRHGASRSAPGPYPGTTGWRGSNSYQYPYGYNGDNGAQSPTAMQQMYLPAPVPLSSLQAEPQALLSEPPAPGMMYAVVYPGYHMMMPHGGMGGTDMGIAAGSMQPAYIVSSPRSTGGVSMDERGFYEYDSGAAAYGYDQGYVYNVDDGSDAYGSSETDDGAVWAMSRSADTYDEYGSPTSLGRSSTKY